MRAALLLAAAPAACLVHSAAAGRVNPGKPAPRRWDSVTQAKAGEESHPSCLRVGTCPAELMGILQSDAHAYVACKTDCRMSFPPNAARLALYSSALRCKWARVEKWSCVDCRALRDTKLLYAHATLPEYDDAADAFTASLLSHVYSWQVPAWHAAEWQFVPVNDMLRWLGHATASSRRG